VLFRPLKKSSHAGYKIYYLRVGDQGGVLLAVMMECTGHGVGVLGGMCVQSNRAVV